MVFSSATEGTLAATTEHRDVRQSEERSFALEAACMTHGLSDAALVTVDGVEYYLAYAPMPSIGWSLGTLIEKEAVVHPANAAKGIVLAQEEDFSASMRGFFMDNLCRMAFLAEMSDVELGDEMMEKAAGGVGCFKYCPSWAEQMCSYSPIV
ncbi:MAG: hypothetical protein J5963_08100 [Schwartzia sp.]|nr:hypothetical protein [Schwartzia sp. (in: firmicutes)]